MSHDPTASKRFLSWPSQGTSPLPPYSGVNFMREQQVLVAIVQDSHGRFLVTFNPKWGGYAFPMIAPAGGRGYSRLAGDSGGRARSWLSSAERQRDRTRLHRPVRHLATHWRRDALRILDLRRRAEAGAPTCLARIRRGTTIRRCSSPMTNSQPGPISPGPPRPSLRSSSRVKKRSWRSSPAPGEDETEFLKWFGTKATAATSFRRSALRPRCSRSASHGASSVPTSATTGRRMRSTEAKSPMCISATDSTATVSSAFIFARSNSPRSICTNPAAFSKKHSCAGARNSSGFQAASSTIPRFPSQPRCPPCEPLS